MFGGKLNRVRFKYTGPSLEAVLDRLPTAQIIGQDEEGWEMLGARVFVAGAKDIVTCLEGNINDIA